MGYKPMVIFVWDGQGGHPDHSLPPGLGGEVDPGYGVESPEHPSQGLPSGGRPPRPGQLPSRPGRPVDPGYGVGEHPPLPVLPDQSLPGQPGQPPATPSTLPALPQGAFLVAWVPGHGYVAVRLGAKPDHSLPGGGQPPRPDQGLPEQPGTPPTTKPSPTPTPQGRR